MIEKTEAIEIHLRGKKIKRRPQIHDVNLQQQRGFLPNEPRM